VFAVAFAVTSPLAFVTSGEGTNDALAPLEGGPRRTV
jgi:hypothetical protein